MYELVEQKVEPRGACHHGEGMILRRIEDAGRTSYLSHDRMEQGSEIAFFRKMERSGHMSVLEHGNICVSCNRGGYVGALDMRIFAQLLSEAVGMTGRSQYFTISADDGRSVIASANVRAWVEMLHALARTGTCDPWEWMHGQLIRELQQHYPIIFSQFAAPPDLKPRLNCRIETVVSQKRHILDTSRDIPLFGFRITCDRGITHEIVRHRALSFTQESTRYVDYSGRPVRFIKDCRAPHTLLQNAVDEYKRLRGGKTHKQDARDVLPHCLASDVYVSGRWSGWKNFLELRLSRTSHPRIRRIAMDIYRWFAAKFPEQDNFPALVADLNVSDEVRAEIEGG